MSIRPITRRGFLIRAAAFSSVAGAGLLRAEPAKPSDTVTLGFIGSGGRASQMLPVFMNQNGARVLAVCDVSRERREAAKAAADAFYGNSDCTAYRDFRDLLARPDLDALYIATGDRWHARLAILAMQAGKDVYCEKPISLSMREGEAVVEAADRYRRIYQGGVQRRNVGNFVTAMALAAGGRLGKLHTLHAGMAGMGRSAANHLQPAQPEPAPDDFDWPMWLGPAPWRPYSAATVRGWHGEYDYHGDLTEWGSHTLDLCQKVLGRENTAPVRYTPVDDTTLTAHYADGIRVVLRQKGFRNSCAVRFEGDEGWVETDDSGDIQVSSPTLLDNHKIQTETWQRPVAHPAEFLACVKSRQKPSAPPDALHFTHVACHAATIAYHLNRELTFDPAALAFARDAEANRLIHRFSRAPWTI
ncbi:MAG: Gfo/Idh/MocA family oxidoreductase [Verrucomicrobiota bacterium]|jgi:predicted dehydrogenase|nr:Gfo/Idh/MocA family oxidoreductase [Verrucomicrobiota bacterium]